MNHPRRTGGQVHMEKVAALARGGLDHTATEHDATPAGLDEGGGMVAAFLLGAVVRQELREGQRRLAFSIRLL
ncbi:MAG: hypothetical protein AB1430_16615 [Pseudomonadota bacterium]